MHQTHAPIVFYLYYALIFILFEGGGKESHFLNTFERDFLAGVSLHSELHWEVKKEVPTTTF